MKLKTLFVYLIGLLFLVPLSAVTSHAMVDVVCFGDNFVRGTGEPVPVSATFPGISGLATVKLWNGAEDGEGETVSSSTVSVNGTEIFGPSNFNQNVNYLEAIVSLNEGDNTLEVCLKSKPGGKIRIEITQEVDAAAAAFVGPTGGVVEGAGAKIEIPPGAVNEYQLFTMTEVSEMPPLPVGATPLSNPIDIQCQTTAFNGYVLVTIPLNTAVTENDSIVALSYDKDNAKWKELAILGISTERNEVIFATTHFSIFIIQNSTLVAYPDEAYTDFSITNDIFNENVENSLAYLESHGYTQYTQYGTEGDMCRFS